MIIDQSTAGVLAGIIPVGLLIVGFEIRSVPKIVATDWIGTLLLWWLGAILLGGLAIGFAAEYVLVNNMLRADNVQPFGSFVVSAGLSLLGSASFLLLLASLGDTLGITERLSRRAMHRRMSDPAERERIIEHVSRHHGESS